MGVSISFFVSIIGSKFATLIPYVSGSGMVEAIPLFSFRVYFDHIFGRPLGLFASPQPTCYVVGISCLSLKWIKGPQKIEGGLPHDDVVR